MRSSRSARRVTALASGRVLGARIVWAKSSATCAYAKDATELVDTSRAHASAMRAKDENATGMPSARCAIGLGH